MAVTWSARRERHPDRRLGRRLLALVLALALAGVASAVSSAPSRAAARMPAARPADALASLPGDYGSALAGRFGERYAGAWVERADDGTATLVVGVRHPADRDDALLDDYLRTHAGAAAAAAARVQAVGHSRADLVRYQRALEDELLPWFPSDVRFSIGRDSRANVVQVATDHPVEGLEGRIRAAGVPADAVAAIVEPALAGERAAHTSPFPPYRGGLLLVSSEGIECTGGPVYANGFGYFATTAGHCLGSGWWCDRTGCGAVGLPKTNTWTQGTVHDADVQFISIAPSIRSDDIFGNGTVVYDVYGELANGSMDVGTGVCAHVRSAEPGGVTCGDVFLEDSTRNYSGHTVRHMWCAEFDGGIVPGDSGGAVFRVRVSGSSAWAAGIIGTTLGCYTTSTWIRAAGNVVLSTS